jgi:predicted TIM-barrel fold metal-dependent hydrolase
MDRINRSYHSHIQLDLEGEPLTGPAPGNKASDYLKRHIQEGRIFVGFDCDDEGLGYAVQRAGPEPFLFASDFPHESFSAGSCRREIDELMHREDLTPKDKAAVLAANAERLYQFAAD